MINNSGIACKVCYLGNIVVITKSAGQYKPISWREHFFGETPFFQRLLSRSIWQRIFIRRTVLDRASEYQIVIMHCNVCGVKYEFLPAKDLTPPKTTIGSIQIRPDLNTPEKTKSR